jgi:hypothetical protein
MRSTTMKILFKDIHKHSSMDVIYNDSNQSRNYRPTPKYKIYKTEWNEIPTAFSNAEIAKVTENNDVVVNYSNSRNLMIM